MDTRFDIAVLTSVVLASSAVADISFQSAVDYDSPMHPAGVAAGDFDKDGDIDIAVATDTPDKISILLNNGSGVFTGPVNYAVPNGKAPGHIVAADLDGDGDLDLAVALQNSHSLLVMKNAGGVFSQAGTTNVGTNPGWIIAGKFDKDADIDLAVVNRDSNNVSILLNNGAGTFAATNVSVGAEPRAGAAGDFDKDGDLDLVVTNHGDRNFTRLQNNGNGGFIAAGTLSVGNDVRPEGITTADLDNDGDVDVAVATSGDNGPGFAAVFINAVGNLNGPNNYPVDGTNPGAIAALDLDADGFADLITLNVDSANISLLPNTKNATFGTAVVKAVGTHPDDLGAGDFNKDGAPDLAFSNRDSDTTSVLINNGPCDADCDGSGELDVDDFICFQTLFATDDPKADCDGSGDLDVDDFICFQTAFGVGCP